MPRQISITFQVIGSCEQTIEIAEDCDLTEEQIIAGLNGNGDLSICTSTSSPAGKLVIIDNGMKQIGTVLDSAIDGEYTDFEAE